MACYRSKYATDEPGLALHALGCPMVERERKDHGANTELTISSDVDRAISEMLDGITELGFGPEHVLVCACCATPAHRNRPVATDPVRDLLEAPRRVPRPSDPKPKTTAIRKPSARGPFDLEGTPLHLGRGKDGMYLVIAKTFRKVAVQLASVEAALAFAAEHGATIVSGLPKEVAA